MGVSWGEEGRRKAFQVLCTSLEVCEPLRLCELRVEHKVREGQVPGMDVVLRSLQSILD